MSATNTLRGILARAFAIAALLAQNPAALAQSVPAQPAATQTNAATTTIWNCWYDGITGILCRLGAAETNPLADAVAAATFPQAAGRAQASPIARDIVATPSRMSGRTIRVPLLSYPENMADAEELADAVMCGARPTCRVEFFRSIAAIAMYLDETADPALN